MRENGLSQVSVTINGRQFRMACEDGQEDHLLKLANDFDERIKKLRGDFGEIGDNRLVVMAALTIADELSEMNGKLRRAQDELTALQDARINANENSRATQAAVVAAFDAASERLESIAKRLNTTLPDGKAALG